MDYQTFLNSKARYDAPSGFDADMPLPEMLFPFQAAIVKWALKRGRAAVFADTGLGKSFIQSAWAEAVHQYTGNRVLIVAPLCVAQQTIREAAKLGITIRYQRDFTNRDTGIIITNYEMLESFRDGIESCFFDGVVLDESSIIKHQDSKTRAQVIELCSKIPYRLSCTATPSPNDFMELGSQAEFLGVMSQVEMLSMFFIHDSGETSKWRLKGHGKAKFWEWLATWSVFIKKPSDIGFSAEGYDLPELIMNMHSVGEMTETAPEVYGIQARQQVKRETVDERVSACAELVNKSEGPFVVWCHRNDESEKLAELIPGSVEIKGSDKLEKKEKAARWFAGELCLCSPTVAGEKSTKRNGSQKIKMSSKSIEIGQKITGMQGGEKFTPETSGAGSRPENNQPSGNSKTQKSDLPKDLSLTESLPTNTSNCSISNSEDARSVGLNDLQTDQLDQNPGQDDCMSITATRQRRQEGCSVPTVTWGLENLKMTHPVSIGPQCTCGHLSGKRVIISKPRIFGFGLNWQHCNQMAFVGLSDSFEQIYQAIRRCWRFGQTKPVTVTMIAHAAEGPVLENIKRKEAQAEEMAASLVEHMREFQEREVRQLTREVSTYNLRRESGRLFDIYNGDCVEVARSIDSNSIDYSVFSPPFSSLYTYSNSDRDMGNSKNYDEFWVHFGFLVDEMARIMRPGRNVSIHCMNLTTSKQRDGVIGIRDFRGDVIREFQKRGFIYHSEVCIWKDPVVAMQRTKALGLLWKQIKKDSSMSRQGLPDYVVTFRKPGVNTKPIAHTPEEFPVDRWQHYASPVWFDIKQSNTLNGRIAREDEDERHIAPLQLDLIHRCLDLWSAKDDLVFSPFTGIGSEGVVSVQMGRRFVGAELKRSYFDLAHRMIAHAEDAVMNGTNDRDSFKVTVNPRDAAVNFHNRNKPTVVADVEDDDIEIDEPLEGQLSMELV